MVQLGKIQKPDVSEFTGKRKLYCIANIYSFEDAPDEFNKLIEQYWYEVIQHIEKIEIAGKIEKIFCETIYQHGDEALSVLSKINIHLSRIIEKKMKEGAALLPLESREILGPYTDWGNCLSVVFTNEVFNKVLEFYKEYSEKRLRHMFDTIEENLSEAEAGLLIMKDEERAKFEFPKDIEVFLITPPSYDDIMTWLRTTHAAT
ncbi:hypothetical protein [Desulfosediminicola flagellatus]|uniref:hypothetical protein n=1 Tax=Desulfosediminicola flagellatus TaxID=2569541 RepID=UPI0010ADA500|nr:hypothetical protein [Desulfosediminicola flagellatus]